MPQFLKIANAAKCCIFPDMAAGNKEKKKVFVGMSGGVDSSVAAKLLKDAGLNVVGVFLKCFNLDGCAEQDAEDARRTAEHLNVPFYTMDLEKEYKEKVVGYMIRAYASGITPNPDVMCNREIKFGIFLERALKMGADYVATGHYARLRRNDKCQNPNLPCRQTGVKFQLLQAKDKNKDQTYFLWTLTQEQLKHCLFPIGDYTKDEVRQIAREAGLPTAEKKDSQGICFLGTVKIRDFLKEYLPVREGRVITPNGTAIGTHEGTHFYTVGQRHGLNVSTGRKMYIASKDKKTNTITAVAENDPALYKKEISLTEVNFTMRKGGLPHRFKAGSRIFARIRYQQPLQKAFLDSNESGGCKLVFDEPQKFVTPGQSAVFYSAKGEMLGGGIIT